MLPPFLQADSHPFRQFSRSLGIAVRKGIRWALGVGVVIAVAGAAEGRLSVSPLFGDHAVLQRDAEIAIWGRGASGAEVKVRFAGEERIARVEANGRWLVNLPAMPGSAREQTLVVESDGERIEAHDVVVGDVWLCSGQSNMARNVARAANAEQEIAAGDHPLIRQLLVERQTVEARIEDASLRAWERATPETVGDFTAVGYYFAREIERAEGVPIGLINCAYNGSMIEAWLSPEVLAGDPDFAVVAERWAEILREYPAKKKAYDEALAEYDRLAAESRARGDAAFEVFRAKHSPPRIVFGPGHYNTPSGLYLGMFEPLRATSLRGVLWYQGEGNGGRGDEYAKLFQALIESWRADLHRPELPFYWVQLAGRGKRSGWPTLRDAQSAARALPYTGQALAIDIGEENDTHPKNKQEVGRRLALIALAGTYGHEDVVFAGPEPDALEWMGDQVRIHFTNTDLGLVARDGAVGALEVVGDDGEVKLAEGWIEGDTLVVHGVGVAEIREVRYAWKDFPDANLYNGAGLPALPFRKLR